MTEIGSHTLSDLLSGGIFDLFLILARVGVAFSFLPGFGDTYVNPKTRMLIILSISFVLLPVLGPVLPPIPKDTASLLALYVYEAGWGLFLGLIARIMLMSLDLAGTLIATNTGLSAATSVNPQLSDAGPIVTTFLTMAAILLIFVTNMHHMMIEALVKSYDLFKPGLPLPTGDVSEVVVRIVSHAFQLGFQLAAPFVVLGLVFNVGLGLLARLVPQMQVFLVGIPIQIIMGMTILSLVMMTILQLWLKDFQDAYFGVFH